MLYRYKQKSYVVWSKQEEEDRAVHVLYITVDQTAWEVDAERDPNR